jgi:hypothetical protein
MRASQSESEGVSDADDPDCGQWANTRARDRVRFPVRPPTHGAAWICDRWLSPAGSLSRSQTRADMPRGDSRAAAGESSIGRQSSAGRSR